MQESPGKRPRRRESNLWLWIYALTTVGILLLAFVLSRRLGNIEEQLDYVADGSDTEAGAPLDLPAEAAGQRIYVPTYSHVFHEGGKPLALETTLSVRNVDPESSIVITTVDYFDTGGRLLRSYLESPRRLEPLVTVSFLVPQQDSAGGSGANFIVEWIAEERVSPPLVEAVMVGSSGSRTLAFTSRGHPLPTLEP